MSLEQSLFEGKLINLGPIDREKDPEIESRWTHDPYYLRMLGPEPARPLAPAQIKKMHEALEKQLDEKNTLYYFAVRKKEDDRLVGFVRLYWIEWPNGIGRIQMGIGSAEDRGCGFGSEALRLALRYAFSELNLFRLTAVIPQYNQVARHVFSKAGFIEEVRRREAIFRDGRRWDILHYGLLREEWHS